MDLLQENIRFNGPLIPLYSYTIEYLVVCPKCQKDALVTYKDSHSRRSGRKLYCGNCHHFEDADNRIRYNQLVDIHCANCGQSIIVSIPNNKQKTTSLLSSCTHCHMLHKVRPRNEEYLLKYESTSAVNDPVFNLPLWLQHSLKSDVFWAYNRTHLADIKAYVQATLRERQIRFFTTMVERLPNFIKVAKNRDAVLKIISQLERKAVAS